MPGQYRIVKLQAYLCQAVLAHADGPIATILEAMEYDGYWVKPGPGYLPKYRSTVWSIILLAQLGGSVDMDSRIERAIQQGVDFLFSIDPADATYPTGWNDKPSRNWRKFGFPVFYVTDLLQTVDALVRLGYGDDPRLTNAINLIREKQDTSGRWPLEYEYSGKTWVEFGKKKAPKKWVTLRALWVLKHANV